MYGAPRVIYNPNKDKKVVETPKAKPVVETEFVAPIEEPVKEPETVKADDKEVMIPTTFVKKSVQKGDVNQYTKKNKNEE